MSKMFQKCFKNIQTNSAFEQARLKSDLDFVILMYIILKNKNNRCSDEEEDTDIGDEA